MPATDLKLDWIVGEKYRLLRQIGVGSFGEIYAGYDICSGEEVAIKLEPCANGYLHLENEYKTYQILGRQHAGIPQMKWFGIVEGYTAMALNLLGPSLEELFISNNRKFTLGTVLIIADQMLSSIEYIHSRRIIHRDLKPDNILIGTCPTKQHIYVIDFGLSRQYRDPETNIHIPFRDGLPLIGTVRYASVNALIGVELSRRDDIESFAYILIYLMRGSLPWQGTTKGEKRQANRQKKLSVNPEVLCDGLPIAFKKCLQYARSLEFSERPDYQYLRGLFTDLHRQLVHDDFEFLSLGKTPSRSVTLPITGSDSTKTETLPIQKRRVRGVQTRR